MSRYYGEAEVGGVTIKFSTKAMFLDYMADLRSAGSAQETAAPETPKESGNSEAGLPEGYITVGSLSKKVVKDYKSGTVKFPKGSLVIGKKSAQGNLNCLAVNSDGKRVKVAAKLVKMASEASTTDKRDTSTKSKADGNYTTFGGQVVIAGQKLDCRIAEGKLQRGGEATNIHFSVDLREVKKSKKIRRILSANNFRFSNWLTQNTDDSRSSWYINTILTVEQIQALFDAS